MNKKSLFFIGLISISIAYLQGQEGGVTFTAKQWDNFVKANTGYARWNQEATALSQKLKTGTALVPYESTFQRGANWVRSRANELLERFRALRISSSPLSSGKGLEGHPLIARQQSVGIVGRIMGAVGGVPGRVMGAVGAVLTGLVGTIAYKYAEKGKLSAAQQEMLNKLGYLDNASPEATGYSPQALLLGAAIGEELVRLKSNIGSLSEPNAGAISQEIGLAMSRIGAKGILPYYVVQQLQQRLVNFALSEGRLPFLQSVESSYALAYQVALVLIPFIIARYAAPYLGRGAQALYSLGLSAKNFVSQMIQPLWGGETEAVEVEQQ